MRESCSREMFFVISASVGIALVSSEIIRRFGPAILHIQTKKTALANKEYGRKLLEEEFTLNKTIVNCNNGSFGLVPRKLIEEQKRIMDEREQNPDAWYRYVKEIQHQEAVEALARFTGSHPKNVVFVENASTGVNAVLKSIPFKAGDKILLNTHTYPAVTKTVKVLAEEKGLEEVTIDLKLPLMSDDDIISKYIKSIEENPGVKLAIIDYISSCSAILMPVEKLLKVCHERGVQVLLDAAHAPGQVPLRLEELGADYVTGNFHKWMFSPRGNAFLYVHPNQQAHMKPLVASHTVLDADFGKRFYPQSTLGTIQYLLIQSAIKFHDDLGGLESYGKRNAELATWAAKMLSEAWNTPELPISRHLRAPFMAVVELPPQFKEKYPVTQQQADSLIGKLYEQYQICTAFVQIEDKFWCRVSCPVWSSKEDFFKLRDAVIELANSL